MADEIKQVTYYMGSLPNKAGEGVRVLNAFKDAGIDMVAFLGYRKSARMAEVVVVVTDASPNPAPIAKKAGLVLGKKQKAFFITGEDQRGAVAAMLQKLADAKINIVSYHGLGSVQGRYGALLTVEAADFRKAAKAIGA